MENYFKKLNSINVNDKTEKKGNLTYLSWAWASGRGQKAFTLIPHIRFMKTRTALIITPTEKHAG